MSGPSSSANEFASSSAFTHTIGIGASRWRAEDLRSALARWIAAGDEREPRISRGAAGVTVELLQRGRLRARGLGKDDLEALANALFGRQHDTRPPPRLSGTFRKTHDR